MIDRSNNCSLVAARVQERERVLDHEDEPPVGAWGDGANRRTDRDNVVGPGRRVEAMDVSGPDVDPDQSLIGRMPNRTQMSPDHAAVSSTQRFRSAVATVLDDDEAALLATAYAQRSGPHTVPSSMALSRRGAASSRRSGSVPMTP